MNTFSSPASNDQPVEGPVARQIEKRTSKIPSDVFLWAAGAAIVGSMVMQIGFQGARTARLMRSGRLAPLSLFIGQWAPTFLLLGLYNKLVKVAGSDRSDGPDIIIAQ